MGLEAQGAAVSSNRKNALVAFHLNVNISFRCFHIVYTEKTKKNFFHFFSHHSAL